MNLESCLELFVIQNGPQISLKKTPLLVGILGFKPVSQLQTMFLIQLLQFNACTICVSNKAL